MWLQNLLFEIDSLWFYMFSSAERFKKHVETIRKYCMHMKITIFDNNAWKKACVSWRSSFLAKSGDQLVH